MDETQMANFKKAYRAALPVLLKEYTDARIAKDHASAIATAVAFCNEGDVRESAALSAAKAAI